MSSAKRTFPQLLSPGRIGPLETPNRIIMSPMGTNLGETDGRVGERLLAYYEARARGGAGLLITGVAAVAYPHGQAIPGQVAVSDDAFLPGLEELARRIHRHGARAALQLQHAGKVATRDIAAGRPLWVPSLPSKGDDMGAGLMQDLTADEVSRLVANLAGENARIEFHEMTREDIAEAVRRFAEAAARAQRAGFDGVELHAGHGYLIASFLSPASNHRTDEYGGPLENRARFLVETIRAVREATGPEFAVWCRMDACEYRIDGGITLDDARAAARLAEQAGAHAIHVSAYANPYIGAAFTEAPLVHRPAGFLEFAAAIKREVSVPVIAVGRISPERAEQALSAGEADFIAMARPLLADPDLPRKLAEGRRREVRPCVYCYTCVGNIFVNDSVVCAVNPRT
ncbi:MAG: NADH:flavin oxidoreductase, partial [Deltaproteobacteria bacterium]